MQLWHAGGKLLVPALICCVIAAASLQTYRADAQLRQRDTGSIFVRPSVSRVATHEAQQTFQPAQHPIAPTAVGQVASHHTSTAVGTQEPGKNHKHYLSAEHALVLARAAAGVRFNELSRLIPSVLPSREVCSSTVTRRLDFTHRKPRPRERSSQGVLEATRGLWPTWVVKGFPQAATVYGPPPICFAPAVNISKPFGSWSAAFHNVTAGTMKLLRSPQMLPAEPPAHVAVISPGVAVGGYSVGCDGTALTAGGCLWELHAPKPLPWSESGKSASVAVSLCDAWCKGYYHFTHEHLPRIALVHQLLLDGRATLVLPHTPNGFQKQFFVDILGVKKILAGPVAADTVLHPSPMRCGNTFSETLHLFRQVVFRRLNISGNGGGRLLHLLFAERSKGSRMASNYAEIKKHIMTVFGDRVTFATTGGREHVVDQLKLFHAADIVLGPHGANLANAMFMRPGTHVIEMASLAKGNMCYYTTAVRVGLHYHLIPHMNGKDAAYTLDPALVESHVRFAIDALGPAPREY